jgi:hypothetical protein
MSFEASTAEMFQVGVFWVLMPCSFVAGCHLHPENGGSMDLRNIGILLQHYTASQSRSRVEINFNRSYLSPVINLIK